ncbi:hypothetical protein FJT64_022370 [Amphibalanus amphitrite]|uniref:Apple domain-containing protein n=1 Tax=Amphibalanus amphitrite TaxID=1232801 RepID=A0A6A4WLF2_AMPAM|nr:hypothetical protein FJT64_022370 [Amphibalanus amphitrite]
MTPHLLLLAAILHQSRACQEIYEYFGTLDASHVVSNYTLNSAGTSCQCCALCHKHPTCQSFSFDTRSLRCTLYDKVASSTDFYRQRESAHSAQYFLMPARSRSGEFCRRDADCVTPGDLCRGRTCTTATTVTCRDIHRAGPRLPDHRYWSVLNGQQVLTYCRMEGGFGGATLLLAYQSSGVTPWSYGNLQDKPTASPSETQDFSILKYADVIRDHQTSAEYHVWIIAKATSTLPETQQNFTASRSLSLLGTKRYLLSSGLFTAVPDLTYDIAYLVFPHITTNCTTLYSTGNYDCNSRRALVRSDDRPWWPFGAQARDTILIYITE